MCHGGVTGICHRPKYMIMHRLVQFWAHAPFFNLKEANSRKMPDKPSQSGGIGVEKMTSCVVPSVS